MKVDAKRAQQQREAARNRQALGVVVATLVVVAGFVFLSTQLKNDTTPAAAPKGSSASATSAPSATTAAVAGCTPAPPVPTKITKVAKPNKATAAGKTFTAVVTTNCGDITLRLDGAKAPQTVASFVGLAKAGYFADSPCHRITKVAQPVPLFVLQCGDPMGGAGTGPGYSYGIENAPKDGKYPRGSLAMARTTDPNSNADQFFIVYRDTDLSSVPAGYSIFGTVTGGMDIVDKIAAAGVSGGATDGAPAAPISILKVAVTEKKA
nr:peptidylprolyl isomerase [Pedococcus badiiscoriae]